MNLIWGSHLPERKSRGLSGEKSEAKVTTITNGDPLILIKMGFSNE